MNAVFETVLHSSLQASLLALCVLVIQNIGQRWISARLRHGLWLIVVLRLVLPISWPMPGGVPLGGFHHTDSTLVSARLLPAESSGADMPEPEATSIVAPAAMVRATSLAQPAAGLTLPDVPEQPTGVVPLIWIAGALASSAWLGLRFIRLRHARESWPLITVGRLRTLLDQCLRELQVHRPVELRGGEVGSPAVIGIWRPCVLLPEFVQQLSDAELRLVYLHELQHIRRGDVALNWGLAVLSAVHWFNPLLRGAFRTMERVRELACDEGVLARLPDEDRRRYARTLVKVLELSQPLSRPALAVGAVSLFRTRNSVALLEERIRTMSTVRKTRSVMQAPLAVVLLLGLGWLGFTRAQEPLPLAVAPNKTPEAVVWPEPRPRPPTGPQVRIGGEVLPAAEGAPQASLRSYPVDAALKQFDAAFQGEPGKARERLLQWAKLIASGAVEAEAELETRSGQRLLVRCEDASHRQLKEALTRIGELGLHDISIEMVFAKTTWKELESLGLKDAKASPAVDDKAYIGFSQTLDEPTYRRLLKELKSPLRAPKVGLYDGYRAIVKDVVHRVFAVAGKDGQPKTRVVSEGTTVLLRPQIDADGLLFNVHCARTEVTKVETRTVVSEAGRETVLQVPDVSERALETTQRLQSGQVLAFAAPEAGFWTSAERPMQLYLWRVVTQRLPVVADQELITCCYSVADLVVPIPESSSSKEASEAKVDFGPLIDVVQTIEPHTWDNLGGGGSARAFEPTLALVIRQRKDVHDQIADLLARIRKSQNESIEVSMLVITTADEKVAGLKAGDETTTARADDLRRTVDAALKHGERLSAPKLTLFNGTTGEIQIGDDSHWLLSTIISKNRAVQVRLALNATEAADALANSWSASVPEGEALLIDATRRLRTAKQGANPLVFAAKRDPELLDKIMPGDGKRTYILIVPRIVQVPGEVAPR